MDVVSWFLAHWADIVGVVTGLVGVASIIVGLTPTPKDDEALAWVKGLLRRFSLLRHSDEPGTLKLPGAK